MYKVFFSDKTLTFSSEKQQNVKNIFFNNNIQFDEALYSLLNSKLEIIHFFSDNLSYMWNAFLNHFKLIEASGGIVRNLENQYLFISRFGKWDLPKGKIEDGETKEESAIREIEEECSIKKLELKEFLNTTFHIYFHKEYVIKKTYWFEVYCSDTNLPKPQKEENIEKVIWANDIDIQRLLENTYPNIKLLINDYLEKNRNI